MHRVSPSQGRIVASKAKQRKYREITTHPFPIDEAGREPTSNKPYTAPHKCVWPVAPALAPAWVPNFGGGLPRCCPSLTPVSGPEPRASGSPHPRHRRGSPSRKKLGPKMGSNGPKMAQSGPDRVRDRVRAPGSMTFVADGTRITPPPPPPPI